MPLFQFLKGSNPNVRAKPLISLNPRSISECLDGGWQILICEVELVTQRYESPGSEWELPVKQFAVLLSISNTRKRSDHEQIYTTTYPSYLLQHLQVTHYQLMKCEAIRAFAQKRHYLVWPEDPQDLVWFYEKLFSKILKNSKVQKFSVDKAEPVKDDIQTRDKIENIRAVTWMGHLIQCMKWYLF